MYISFDLKIFCSNKKIIVKLLDLFIVFSIAGYYIYIRAIRGHSRLRVKR